MKKLTLGIEQRTRGRDTGGAGNDILIGGAGDDIVYGNDGSNFINLESIKRYKREAANDAERRMRA